MNGWKSVSRSNPCPICGGPDNCTRSDDGHFVYCGRVSDGSIRQNKGGQCLHILDDVQAESLWLKDDPRPATLANTKLPREQPTRDWGRIARAEFSSPNADSGRTELAKILGKVSVESLERIGVGYTRKGTGWVFPERDATGNIIGINRRFANGDKRRDKGGNAGLTFDPSNWIEPMLPSATDIHLVEGASDTAAMLTMKLCAIGRPSNLGGVELLGELLKQVPTDRRIVVVGENDQKPHDTLPAARQKQHKPDCPHCSVCWPGWYGAMKTAEQLVAILGREILTAMTPDGRKDVRDWTNCFEETAED